VKVAVTDLAASIVTLQVSDGPLHAPVHPEKTEAADGTAVNVTTVLRLYGSEQSAPQAIPAGLELTVPRPLPAVVTVSNRVGTTVVVKVAVTDLAASIVTLQPADPVHAPDHPEKTELAPAVAVRATTVPRLYGSEQSVPQEIPAGLEVTVPTPVPAVATVINRVVTNVAVTDLPPSINSVQLLPPRFEQAPDQPAKTEPGAEVAVSNTTVLKPYRSEQSVPQLMPGENDVTVPLPAPLSVTVSSGWAK
jgi:hypothetical protein